MDEHGLSIMIHGSFLVSEIFKHFSPELLQVVSSEVGEGGIPR